MQAVISCSTLSAILLNMKTEERPRLTSNKENKSSPYTEQLHDPGGSEPFVRDGNQNKFFGNKAEPEHGGERDKGCESQHLMEYSRLTLRIIGYTCQYRLGDSVDHSGDEGVPLIVPVVGLAKVSDLLLGIELT